MFSLYQSVHSPAVLHNAAFGSSEEELEQELGGWEFHAGTGDVHVDCCWVNLFGVEIGVHLFEITGQIDLYGTVNDPRLGDGHWPGLDIGSY
jgi:hypothetical protein